MASSTCLVFIGCFNCPISPISSFFNGQVNGCIAKINARKEPPDQMFLHFCIYQRARAIIENRGSLRALAGISSGSQPVYRKLFPHGPHSSKNNFFEIKISQRRDWETPSLYYYGS